MSKVAFVTGGAKRIGAAILKKLHQENFNVIIHYNNSENEAKSLAANLNAKRKNSAFLVKKNLQFMQLNDAKELIASIYEWKGRLDLLVNNASMFNKTLLHKIADDQNQLEADNFASTWSSLFAINLLAPFLLSIAAFPYLKKQQGAIINISDIHGYKPLLDYSIYCQTKAALNMQTKSLAREFAPDVRVNAIAPGAIIWPEDENKLNSETQKKILAKIPLNHQGNPENIADALLTLVQNSYITGQILNVDGGRSIVN